MERAIKRPLVLYKKNTPRKNNRIFYSSSQNAPFDETFRLARGFDLILKIDGVIKFVDSRLAKRDKYHLIRKQMSREHHVQSLCDTAFVTEYKGIQSKYCFSH